MTGGGILVSVGVLRVTGMEHGSVTKNQKREKNMGMFDDFATDNISIIKSNGQRYDGLKASVQRDKIFFENSSIFVEPRDLIQRNMSNGGVETYEVIDPGFVEAIMDFEAHYQMRVRKMGMPEAEKAVRNITYNISGANARVNNHSVDNSINNVTISPEVPSLIAELRAELSKLGLSSQEQVEVGEVVDEIESQLSTQAPKKTVIKSLLAALPHVETVASISALILGMVSS